MAIGSDTAYINIQRDEEDLFKMSYFVDMYKNYVNFSGRATRKQFWCAYGIWLAIYVVLYILAVVGGLGSILSMQTSGDMSRLSGVGMSGFGMLMMGLMAIFSLGSLLPLLAIEVRRLRDAGFQWWVLLLCIVGNCAFGIGSIVLLVLLCLPTKDGDTY